VIPRYPKCLGGFIYLFASFLKYYVNIFISETETHLFYVDMHAASFWFWYPLLSVNVAVCNMYVCVSASLRLNISETKRDSGWLISYCELVGKCARGIE